MKNSKKSAEQETAEIVYSEAIDKIEEAIIKLGAYTKRVDDPVASEAIANLGVVLFELKQ